jgi:hypothetical protein
LISSANWLAHVVDDDVYTLTLGRGKHGVGKRLALGIDAAIDAERRQRLELGVRRARGEHLARPHQPGDLDGDDADAGRCGIDEHGLAARQSAIGDDRVVLGRDGDGQARRLLER